MPLMAEIPSPRLRLEEWGRAFPGLWRAVAAERETRRADGVDWPSPVFLPLERAGAATLASIHARGHAPPATPGELAPAACTTQCLAAWRMTQGIYRVDRTLYDALVATPITGDIPSDVLLYLPEWCVYVETPGLTVPVRAGAPLPVLGLWYWLDQAPGRAMVLCIGIDTGRKPPLVVQHVPLVGTIEQAVAATIAEWSDAIARGNVAPSRAPPPGYANAARIFLPPALSLVLYLCASTAEIAGAERPHNPAPVMARRHGMRLYPADGPRRWEVGMRLGAALRAAAAAIAESDGTAGARHMRPHVRRAHWHTYLLGPRKDAAPTARHRELRWLPPIPIAVEDYDALPSVLHRVAPHDAG